MEIVAAGKPDIQKLIRMGVVDPKDIDPKTGLKRGVKSKYRLVKKRRKNSETGKYEMVELKENYGHVEDEEFKGWRVGLSPEKYWKLLEKQHFNRTYRNRKDNCVPLLTEGEATLFSEWLDDNTSLVEDKEPEEVPVDPIVKRKRKAIDKKKEEKKTPKKVTNKSDE